MQTVIFIACNLISKTVRQFFIKNVVVLGCLAYIKIISHTDGKNLLIGHCSAIRCVASIVPTICFNLNTSGLSEPPQAAV